MPVADTRDLEGDGEWSKVQDLVIIPIHSIVLPDGKVFSFGTDEYGIEGGQFIYSLYDPKTGQNRILENTTDTNLFCSNMAIDPATGNVIIMGGDQYRVSGGIYSGVADVNVFDYRTQTIRASETGDMNYARWYGTVATLDDGEILIVAGRDGEYLGSTTPELYNFETGFRELPGADIPDINDNSGRLYATFWYPHLWQASDGRVFMVESEGKDLVNEDVFVIDVEGEGSATKIDTLPFDTRNTSPSVMFDVDRVLIVADDGWVWQGDLSQDVPVWQKAFFIVDENDPDLGSARTNGNFILMPDGRIALIGGGGSDTILGNQLEDAQYGVIVWDPQTGQTETWADTNLARLYHSTGLILPDGTFWAGGGGAPGPLQNDNVEIFTPPYLYDADGNLAERPEIVDAPRNVAAGDTFRITVDDAADIKLITAIRSGAQTHARNSDARLLKLDFEIIDATTIEISAPSATVFGPGLWMLYAVDADGVPSEAALIGADMAAIVDTPPILAPETVFYDINDDDIEGAFLLSVNARFDDAVGATGQTVFEFLDDATGNSVSLAQMGNGTDIAFIVVQDGQTYQVLARGAIVEGEAATWRVGVGLDGVMRLAKGDTLIATLDADLEVAEMSRGNLRVGSAENGNALKGVVRNLYLADADDYAALDPNSSTSPSSGHGSAQVMTTALVSDIEDLAGNQAPIFVGDTSSISGTVTELPDFADGEDQSILYTGGILNVADAERVTGATASVLPQGDRYAGKLEIVGDVVAGPTEQSGHLQWRYSVSDGEISSLVSGQSLVQRYDITVTDADGATVIQTVSVTINGADDTLGSSDVNEFFGAVDEPAFKLLSGFVNGLVKISADSSDVGTTGANALATGYLDLVGLDDFRLGPDAEVNPTLKPFSDGVDRYLTSLSAGGNGFADWIGLMTGEGLNAVAAFGDRIGDATGKPTPFIDAFEFYLLQGGGGIAYAVGEITGSTIGFFDGIADAFFGAASATLDATGADPLGVFSLSDRGVFDGVRGVTGLDGLSDLTGSDAGDEIVFASYVDRASGGAGSDLLTLYDGAGTIDLGGGSDGLANALSLNGGNVDDVVGSRGTDTVAITVDSRVDRLDLLDGADYVFSAGEISGLNTGSGADAVTARKIGIADLGDDNDTFVAETVELVRGGSGQDEISISTGTAQGGSGNDTFYFIPGGEGVRFEGGSGWDTLVLDLDELGISRGDLVRDLGVWDWWGDVSLWGRSVSSDLLGFELTGVEMIELI